VVGASGGVSSDFGTLERVTSASEADRRLRKAQANALFDPEALDFLTKFENRVALDLDEVGAMAKTPIGWTKIAALMQAYLVEVVGLQMRVTEEGRSQLANLRKYIERVSKEESTSRSS
jgi:hypothetical protein